jgi:hypothetical protein
MLLKTSVHFDVLKAFNSYLSLKIGQYFSEVQVVPIASVNWAWSHACLLHFSALT